MSEIDQNSLDLKRYWALVLQRRYLALSIAVAVLSICTLAGFIMPKVYESSSTILIQRSAMVNPLSQGPGEAGTTDIGIATMQDVITSEDTIDRVIKKLGIDAGDIKSPRHQGLVKGIKAHISVTVKSGGGREVADSFKISYRGHDPKNVRDVVNALLEAYIDETSGYRRSDAAGAVVFLKSQLSEYKDKMEESDKAITEFRRKYPNLVLQTEGAATSGTESFQTQKIDADIKVKELMYKRENLRKQLSGEKELSASIVPTEGSPQARLNYLNNQLVILTTKFTDKHPEVLKTKAEIEDLKRQMARARTSRANGADTTSTNPIYQQLKEELNRTDMELESWRTRSSAFARQQQLAKGVMGGKPKEQEEWTRLQRDRTVFQHIYDDLLKKLETARVSKDIELTDNSTKFKVVDQATLPVFPVSPDPVKFILFGIFFGIVSGAGVVIGIDYLNDSFKDEDFIEKSLNIPVLVAIPSVVVESDVIAMKQLDKKVIIATSAYLSLILLLLFIEFLQRYVGMTILPF